MKKLTKVAVSVSLALGTIFPMARSAEAGVPSCPQYEYLLDQYNPGWSVARMSHYMGRESGCVPDAYNRRGRATGLLQITPVNFRYLTRVLGEPVNRDTLTDPEQNVRAAAALFVYWSHHRRGGYAPWR